MKYGVNTRITAALCKMLREKGADPAALAEITGRRQDLLEAPDRFVDNEDLIVALADSRQQLAAPELARALGVRVARELFPEASAQKISLRAGQASMEQVMAQTLRRLLPALSVRARVLGAGRMRVEVGSRAEYLHSHDHCLLVRGVIEGILAAASARGASIRESTCRVTVDRAGEIGGKNYRLDDEGKIWERTAGQEPGAAGERPVGSVGGDGSHAVAGVSYGHKLCTYEIGFHDLRSLRQRLWAASVGRILNLARVMQTLEKSWMIDPETYDQVKTEWRRWLKWEPSYHLTKAKYLAYLGMLALAAIPSFGQIFTTVDNDLYRAILIVILTLLVLTLGFLLTKMQVDYARRLCRQREDAEKFLQNSGVGVILIKPDFIIEYANPLTHEVHGEVTGRKCYEALCWESEPCADCPLKEVLAGKDQVERERQLIDGNGQRRWFHVTMTPVLDARGQIASGMAVTQDITSRKQLEAEVTRGRDELESSENKYRSFMANAADAIIITDPEHRVLEVSNQMLKLIGDGDSADYLGRDFFDLGILSDDERERVREIFTAMIRERQPRAFETRLKVVGGGTLDIESRAIPILNHGKVAWVQNILRDVTARKQQDFEKDLLLSISHAIKDAPNLDAMIEQSLAGICAVMRVPIGAIFLQSAKSRSLRLAAQTGLSSQAMMKVASLAVDVSAGDVASRSAILKRPIVIGGREGSAATRRLREANIASLAAVPMLLEDEIQGVIYIASREEGYFSPQRMGVIKQVANELAVGIARQKLRDLIEVKNRELTRKNEELEKASLQLLQSEKMASLGQLAAGVAHEINNPMGYINSNLNLMMTYREDLTRMFQAYRDLELDLEKNCPTAALGERLSTIRRLDREVKLDEILTDLRDMISESIEGAERVTFIIKNLKEFSHPETGTPQQANIHDALESTLNIVWNELKYKAEVFKDYGDLPLIACYPQELKQVFMNLLVNASQAIPERGEIRIRTYQDDRWVNIAIGDNGVGIPAAQLLRIFDPFYTTKEVGKGTGLGLSISYSIVAKHGGKILVESEPGKGSTFTVRLPVEQSPSPELARPVKGEFDETDVAQAS